MTPWSRSPVLVVCRDYCCMRRDRVQEAITRVVDKKDASKVRAGEGERMRWVEVEGEGVEKD